MVRIHHMKNNYLKFWGTRGSCPVSGPEYIQFGGNTACLEMRYDQTILIFDAGTGIRPLGKKLIQEKIKHIDLFLSHFHWDHLMGFPFFDLIFNSESSITIWSPQKSPENLMETLFAQPFFPIQFSALKAKITFKTVQEPVTIGPLAIHFHPANHPGGAILYKIVTPKEKIGYASDNESSPLSQDLIQFYNSIDLLIHEAQYFPEEYTHKKGWGHSNLTDVLQLAEKTHAHKLLVTHHDPMHTDTDLMKLAKMASDQSSIPSEWLKDNQVIHLK